MPLVETFFELTEHRARLYRSRTTGEVIAVPLAQEVRLAGLTRPRLKALLAFQKGACRRPRSGPSWATSWA